MARRMNKPELVNHLHDLEVPFPDTATISQLRSLLENVYNNDSAVEAEIVAAASNALCLSNIDEKDDQDDVEKTNSQQLQFGVERNDEIHDSNIMAEEACKNQNPVLTYGVAENAATRSLLNDAIPLSYTNNSPELAADADNCDSVSDIDETLSVLQKQARLLELRRYIATLKEEQKQVSTCKVEFADVEHALQKFSGEQEHLNIIAFINDFEDVMALANADEKFKLLALRRSLIGPARLVLSSQVWISYTQLRDALIKEYFKPYSRLNVYKALEARKWKHREESLHTYVLTMQAIARHSDITQPEVINFVIDGIGNKINNIQLLLHANSLDELKQLIKRYGDKYLLPITAAETKPKNPAFNENVQRQNDVHCYNCSLVGHIKPNCPYPLRPEKSCFRCWQMGHEHRSCPNPRKILTKKDIKKPTMQQVMNVNDGARHNESFNHSKLLMKRDDTAPPMQRMINKDDGIYPEEDFFRAYQQIDNHNMPG